MITLDEFNKNRELRQITVVSFVTATVYIVLSFLDIVIVSTEMKDTFIALHMFATPTILFVVSILAYKQKYYKLMMGLYILAPILAGFYNLYIITLSTEAHFYYAEMYLGIMWVFVLSGLDFKKAIYTSTTMFLMHVSGVLYFDTFIQKELVMYLFWFFAAYSFGFVGAYLIDRAYKETYLKHIKLLNSLKNKDILMRETYHRVKNNLQVVSSLLALESKSLEDEKAKDILNKNRQRIHSMSLIHEQLYSFENLDKIDFGLYLKNLIDEIKKLYLDKDVVFNIEYETIEVSLDKGVPLGLVVNEILTNSLKHAFDENDKDKIITIKTKIDNDKLRIEISDNGKGIEKTYEGNEFGRKLIKSLVKLQLHGTFECYNENGFVNIITLDKDFLNT
ncbi:sensor histidine kinase [Sulfurimonas sp.]